MKRWLKRLAMLTTGCGLVLGCAVGYVLNTMSQADARHAEFLASGKTVNEFLKSYSRALVGAFENKDTSRLLALYSDDYFSPDRGLWRLKGDLPLGDASLAALEAIDHRGVDRGTLSEELQFYLDGIARIDNVACKINLIEEVVPHSRVSLTVKFVLDGQDVAGLVFQDRFFFRWRLNGSTNEAGVASSKAGGAAGWKIAKDELIEGVRVAGSGAGFLAPDPRSIGIDYTHQRDPKLNACDPNVRLRFAVIEHAGGGISAVDYDGDGLTDLFFADGRRSRLYRNMGASSTARAIFEDATSESGLEDIDQAHCGIFADFDNDGDKDLFVSRYLAPSKFFRNDGRGAFSDCSAEVGLDFNEPSVSACCLDYNRDGFVDLYVGNNGNAFEAAPNIPFYATNGDANRLYRNVDGRKFVDVTESSGTGDTGWTLAVCAGDYDLDGDADLAVANDFGRKALYRNDGDGTFTDVAKDAGVLDFSGGMGIAFGDFDFDGRPDLYTSNINSNQRWYGEESTVWQYTRNVVRTKWIFQDFGHYRELYGLLGQQWNELGKMIGEGNSLFYNNGDGTFRELKDSHTNRAGWSWGVALFDMDNDTDLDIYAANGWISGTNKDDL